MLLITFNEWFGPGRKLSREQALNTEVRERHVAFASRWPLGRAIDQVIGYQRAFNDKHSLAVNFSLLSVSDVDPLSDEQLEAMNVILAERLPQSPDEFE